MAAAEFAERVTSEVRKAFLGQDEVVEQCLAAVLADGHVLVEGMPGLAKTLLARTLATTLGLAFGRVQFTPDLMPSDVTGTMVFDVKDAVFRVHKGPVFAAVLLADEVNRTPPKTQAALLEAMEERQVTIGDQSFALPYPFLVFATQNPIETEGTYPLPEAQLDRFLMKIVIGYPPQEVETEVYRRYHGGFRAGRLAESGVTAVGAESSLRAAREEVAAIQVDDKVLDYIYGLVSATRTHRDVMTGASPRAGLALLGCGKAIAAMRGRDFVIPDDVKELAVPVLRHRLLLKPEAEIEGLGPADVLRQVIEAQQVPR
ncbi:MAG: AAA family ATPase [Fimbriimonadaceae bacterium]